MNETEIEVMIMYLNFKTFDEIDEQMGFKPGWSEMIIKTIRKNYCFGSGN